MTTALDQVLAKSQAAPDPIEYLIELSLTDTVRDHAARLASVLAQIQCLGPPEQFMVRSQARQDFLDAMEAVHGLTRVEEALDTEFLWRRIRVSYATDVYTGPLVCSIDALRDMHSTLVSDLPGPTPLRDHGMMARASPWTDRHIYPQASVVEAAMGRLCETVSAMLRRLDEKPAKPDHLARCFAVAAFAQVHLMDIHPFRDGNGRLGRFVAKRVLDAALPFTVPLVRDQGRYLVAVVDCRLRATPAPLAELMAATARVYCQEAVNRLADAQRPRSCTRVLWNYCKAALYRAYVYLRADTLQI
jgi:hypothetical protein